MAWKIIERYRSMIEQLLPAGTTRRQIYRLASRRIRTLLEAGPTEFVKKTWRGLVMLARTRGHGWRGAAAPQAPPERPERVRTTERGDVRPFVSVIVLNYNGARFLSRCLGSLAQLSYPRERYEVIVVDNASSDNSIALIRGAFPWVRLVVNRENLGFARGNRSGVEVAEGELIVLLNNDTHVDPEWLSALVADAERDPRVGLCTSKICLLTRRVELELSCVPFSPAALGPSGDTRELGVCIASAKVIGGAGEIEPLQGFYGVEATADGRIRWSRGRAVIGVPVLGDEHEVSVEIAIASHRPREAGDPQLEIRTVGDSRLLFRGATEAELRKGCRIVLGPEILARARPVIQNAGGTVFADGSGRDRGAVVQGTEQYYATDAGQYDAPEEVFGACGASMLLKRALLDDVGFLDDGFFMYYEDTDLSWRARLRGWRVRYVPGSVVWHAHCGTSVEWSPFFIFNTDRNRLAMVAKNGTLRQAARAWASYVGGAVAACGRVLLRRLLGAPAREMEGRVLIKLRVMLSLTRALPTLVSKRWAIQRTKRVSHQEIAPWFEPRCV